MGRSSFFSAMVSASLLAGAALAQSAPAPSPAAPRPVNQCFRSHDYQSFRPVNDHVFNIRVNINQFYRIETEGTCPELMAPGAFLITTVRGSDDICGPLDWDLKIGQTGPGGFAEPCIVKSQTLLTPADVAAMPRKEKP